jgi:phage-related minor tail protein
MGLFIKFSQDKAFVNQQLTTIAQSNQEALDDINKRLDSIEKEITAITPVLEDAGANFDSSSSATKKSMEKEIKALDNQLTDLKKTIELLKESKGIY